ncbi:uncharacterized protein PAC_05012 [Phialocephala subalpina]|uniref:DUF7918 domain-containing protein n=1 Tax=Phialocephala subalpina TaxID=576137 RepID=A0A1L7WQS7_9HELO|nr:uncharacterized protein PAC_05012 [Phialocephala subalpina]
MAILDIGKGKTEWTKELEGVKHEASFGKPVTIKAFRFAKIETTGDSAESMVVKSMHQKLRKIGLIEGKGKTEWTKELEGVKHEASFGKPVTIKAFRFAKIETTGDSAESMVVKSMHQKLRKIGLIEIKVYREKGGQQGAILSALPDGFMEDDERENVPEKAVKGDAKSDCTSLGEAEKGKKGSDIYRNTKKIDGDDKPLIIFQALRQLHIIERTPSPSPAPSRSPSPDPDHIPGPDGKTPFEVRLDKEIENERAKRIAAMENELAREKTEKQENAKAMTMGVKRERSDVAMQIKKERGEEASMNAPPAKRPRREFHDLTGDDEDDAFPEGSGGNEGNGE